MAGSLYVVSTPIGNLEDMTVRALNTLKSVGLVAAEDTRRTGLLLRYFGIPTPTTSLHEHNETEKLPVLLQKLSGQSDVVIGCAAAGQNVLDGESLVGHCVSLLPVRLHAEKASASCLRD